MARALPPYVWLTLLIALSYCTRVPAQDARFSQLTATPMLNNPALTGVINGQLRLTGNYQTLFTTLNRSEGYRSVAAAAELRRPVGNGNFAGFGIQLQHDRAGESDFVRSQGALSASYQQQLTQGRRRGNAQFLSGGVQLGLGQRGFDMNKLWYSEQYFVDPITRDAYLDRSLASGEPGGGIGGQIYLDVSAGVAWFATFAERTSAYAGIAAYHLSQPNVSPVAGYSDPLHRRYVLYAGGELPLGTGGFSLLPAVRAMRQGPSFSSLIGANVRYTQREWREIALRVGSWLQWTNREDAGVGPGAVVAVVALETEEVQLGLSYDLTVGPLSLNTGTRGGFELSIIYTRAASYRGPVACPRF